VWWAVGRRSDPSLANLGSLVHLGRAGEREAKPTAGGHTSNGGTGADPNC
jgi:hypothetical protein